MGNLYHQQQLIFIQVVPSTAYVAHFAGSSGNAGVIEQLNSSIRAPGEDFDSCCRRENRVDKRVNLVVICSSSFNFY